MNPTTGDAVSKPLAYLVTGSSGYIGQYLIEQLKKQPDSRVIGLDMKGVAHPDGWQSFEGDLLDPSLPTLLNEIQPDIVFHTAAAPKFAPLAQQLQSTVVGTEHLIQSLAESHVDARVVVLGSAAEYGIHETEVTEESPLRPQGDYGIAKIAQTQTALTVGERCGIPVIVGRIFNVYGKTPNTLAVASLASQIARLERKDLSYPRIKVFNLLGRRDFVHVNDVVRALIALSSHGKAGEIYNIGSGEATQLQEIVTRLLALSELDNFELVPSGDQVDDLSEASITKIINATSWKPGVPLDNGLQRELNYWREEAAVLTV